MGANFHQIRYGAFGIVLCGFAQDPAEAFLDHVVFIGEK